MNYPDNEIRLSRYQGCLVGGAVGDALGAPVEFLSESTIKSQYGVVREMLGGGIFNWGIGETTDDTDQTLAIVDSLIANNGYNPEDIAKRFLAWYKHGPKDIGGTTALGLSQLENGMSFRDSGKLAVAMGKAAANGSLMRTHPLGLYFSGDLESLRSAAQVVSSITHANDECVLACQMASELVSNLVNGLSREDAVSNLQVSYSQNSLATEKLGKALEGYVYPGKIGYVFNTFDIALYSFIKSRDFEETVIMAVAAGGDTDTQATVAGAFAGAFYGIDQIPVRWKSKLNPFTSREIEQKAVKIYSIGE